MNVEILKIFKRILVLATVSSLTFVPNPNGNVMDIPSKVDGRVDQTKSKKGVKDNGTSKKQYLNTELVYTRHSSNPHDSQVSMDHRFTNRSEKNLENENKTKFLYEQRGKAKALQMANRRAIKKVSH